MVYIQHNWEVLVGLIKDNIAEPRRSQLIKLYTKYEDRIKVLPASSKASYHSAFEGGYVHHVLNVVRASIELHAVWKKLGVNVNYTMEELIFSAINHDLGKIGDENGPYYIPNPSEWHVKNQGAIYKHNPDLPYMAVPDRSLFILQQHGIPISFNETLAIKLHDGLYNEGNKEYLMSYSPDNKPITALPYILHQADLASARIEFEQQHLFKKPEVIIVEKKPTKKELSNQILASKSEADNLKNILNNL